MMPPQKGDTLNTAKLILKAQRFCAYKERSSYSMTKKLEAWGAPPKMAAHIVQELINDNFINNERYLIAYIKGKANSNKWGKKKILFMLRTEGFSDIEINKYLNILDDNYDNILKELIQKKINILKPEKNHMVLKNKLIRYSLSKGFEYEKIIKIINKYI